MTARDRLRAVKAGKPFNALDAVFFGVILVAVAVAAVFVFGKKGESVKVTAPNFTAVYPLDTDAVIDVNGYLTLVIESGKAYVESSDCPDKICVQSGAISRKGAMIACLPGGIVISVTGESDFVEVGG